MSNTNCLIAGLPQSGKSTYIGALWYIVQNSKQVIDLCLEAGNNPPDNVQHLNALLDKWAKLQKMRTANDVTDNITINLRRKSDGIEFLLAIPDFRGESIRDIINGVPSETLLSWCEKSTSLLYLVNDINVRELCENMKVRDEESNDEIENQEATGIKDPTFDISQMITPSQDMIILKFLSQNMNFKKVIIGISAWDEIYTAENPIIPEAHMKENSPALYNFIKYRFNDVKIIGISAQGDKYKYKNEQELHPEIDEPKELVEEFEDMMVQKTQNGKRAYVVMDKNPEYDITLPIDYLIS
jgi:hypothetical protein